MTTAKNEDMVYGCFYLPRGNGTRPILLLNSLFLLAFLF